MPRHSHNDRVVVVVEKYEDYSPAASFVETLRRLGYRIFVLSEERHPELLSYPREVLGNLAVNEIGGATGQGGLVSRILRSTKSSLLVTIDGGYSVSSAFLAELEASGIRQLSINFESNVDESVVQMRSVGASVMTILPEDADRMSLRTSVRRGYTSSIVPLAPRVATSWWSDLGQGATQSGNRRVLVSTDGLDRAEMARVASIVSTYSKEFRSCGEVGAEWCHESFESIVERSGSASYLWRADSLNSADSVADFRLELAAACGLTILSEDPGGKWKFLPSGQLEILKSRFDGLAHVFPERRIGSESAFWEEERLETQTKDPSVEFELAITKIMYALVGEPKSNGYSQLPLLISGWYGSGNLGDELILTVLLSALEKAGVAREIRVVTPLPAQTERIHGVPGIDIYDHNAVSREVRYSSATVVGGGGLFQDYSFGAANGVAGMLNGPRQSIGAYAALPFFCEIWDKPWHAFGLGIGPLKSDGGRAAVRKVLRSAESITVRDEESAKLVEAMIGTNTPVVRAPDLVFALEMDYLNTKSRLDGCGDYLILNLRSWNFSNTFSAREVLDSCVSFAELNNLIVVCMPFSPDDHATLSRLTVETVAGGVDPKRLVVLPFTLDKNQILRELSEARLVVAMRYHVHVLSFLAGTPSVGIAYDPKVSSLFEEVGEPELALNVDEIDFPSIFAAMTSALRYDGRLPLKWMDRVLECRERSKTTLENLAHSLAGIVEFQEF